MLYPGDIKIYTFPVDSLGESLGYWGRSVYPKVCSDPPFLDFSSSANNKWSKIMTLVNIFNMGVNNIVQPIHQGPFHGKERLIKNIPRLRQILHNLTHLPVDGEGRGGLPHIILNTPVMDIFYNNTPHYQHKITHFRPKQIQAFPLFQWGTCVWVYHEFFIIRCDVPFHFLFMNQD